jgi:hypothetical protein
MKPGELWESDEQGYVVKIKRIEHKKYQTLYQWECDDETVLIEPDTDCHIVVCRLFFSDHEMIFLFDMFLRHFSKIHDEELLRSFEEYENNDKLLRGFDDRKEIQNT